MRTETTTYMEINLDNLLHNYQELVNYVAPAEVVPVVKSEAYGHGAVQIATALQEAGCQHFAVAMVDEGIQLRNAGISGQIMVIGGTLANQFPVMAKHDLTPVIPDVERLQAWAAIAELEGKRLSYHIKVDVGLGRWGFMPEQAEVAAQTAKALPQIHLKGVCTHLSYPEGTDEHNATEYARYDSFLAHFKADFPQVTRHVAATQAIMRREHMFLDLVRIGGLIYGFQYDCPTSLNLRPVLTYKTKVVQVKWLPAGWGIGYDLEHIVTENTKIAVLPLGWSDGLGSSHVGQAELLVRGKRCKLVGLCTDYAMIDVSQVEDVMAGDEVVLIGEQGGEKISVVHLAGQGGISTSQLLGRASLRTPRLYIRNGKQIAELSILEPRLQASR